MFDFKKSLEETLEAFEGYLKNLFQSVSEIKDPLFSSMKYSIDSGGKRIRPVLALSVAKMLGIEFKYAMPFCLAVELIHTYSLIHDDLPAMDNDDTRRGIPTNHIVYGEGMAILAGDALLNLSYEVLFQNAKDAKNLENYIKACNIVAECAGARGMIAGQAFDIDIDKNTEYTFEELQYLQLNKTAKLISASILSIAILAEISDLQYEKLSDFAINLGLAFQAVDDILDEEGDSSIVGKETKKDMNAGKFTCIKLLGLEKSKELAEKYTNDAINSLKIFGDKSEFLKELCTLILKRKK